MDIGSPTEEVHLDHPEFSGGKVQFGIRHTIEINPFLSYSALKREKEESIGCSKRSEFRPCASLDAVTCLNIKKKHGIDAYNLKGDDGKRLKAIVQREYPHLMTTKKTISKLGDKFAPKLVFGPRKQYASIPAECLK